MSTCFLLNDVTENLQSDIGEIFLRDGAWTR